MPYAKFAFISGTNPKEDFIFFLRLSECQTGESVASEISTSLAACRVEFISLVDLPGKHVKLEVSN